MVIENLKNMMTRIAGYLIIVLAIMSLITFVTGIMFNNYPDDVNLDFPLIIVLFIDFTIMFTILYILAFIQDDIGYRPLYIVKDIMKKRFGKRQLIHGLSLGLWEITMGFLIIIITDTLWLKLMMILFIINGFEFSIFAIHYFKKEKGTFDTGGN